MKEFVVASTSNGQKIEKFIRKSLPEAPLGYIYKAFRKKDIKVNGHWVHKDFVLNEGDNVRIYVTDAQLADFSKPRPCEKKPFPYPIVYEDNNVLIVDKPAGLLVYGDETEKRNTLAQAVLDYLYFKGEYNPDEHSFTPSPAHRLDRNTSGLVIFGKTDAGLKELEELFMDREDIKKSYLALVKGDLDTDTGKIDKPLKKNENSGLVTVTPIVEGGKKALTEWKVVTRFSGCTLVEALLVTGRTHQIRVHFASIGHPLLGDAKYGDFAENKKARVALGIKDQFLHAYKMSFGKLATPLDNLSNKEFTAPLPSDKVAILDRIKEKSKI
jgi:23S rRNA pseudouridine955/2504/2580 synthase